MSSDQAIAPRAGFWPRAFAFAIDFVIVSLPFLVLDAVLFATTAERVEQSGSITFTSCENLREVPEGLAPPPPAGSNFARECRVYFFGAEVARRLQVGRVTKDGTTTTTVSRGYGIDYDRHPIHGDVIGWLQMAIFIAYLFAMETRTGATLGDRCTRIRVVDMSALDQYGVPLRKIAIRYLVMVIGFVPFAIAVTYSTQYAPDVEAMSVWTWLGLSAILTFGWLIIICRQIENRRDPLYDRIAGTAVVHGGQAPAPIVPLTSASA